MLAWVDVAHAGGRGETERDKERRARVAASADLAAVTTVLSPTTNITKRRWSWRLPRSPCPHPYYEHISRGHRSPLSPELQIHGSSGEEWRYGLDVNLLKATRISGIKNFNKNGSKYIASWQANLLFGPIKFQVSLSWLAWNYSDIRQAVVTFLLLMIVDTYLQSHTPYEMQTPMTAFMFAIQKKREQQIRERGGASTPRLQFKS